MASWRIEFSESAENDLADLDKQIARRIIDAGEWLAENFDGIVPIPLGGSWRGFFKFRVGDWRVIYKIKSSESALIVHYIDHRGKIYKRSH